MLNCREVFFSVRQNVRRTVAYVTRALKIFVTGFILLIRQKEAITVIFQIRKAKFGKSNESCRKMLGIIMKRFQKLFKIL